jgi:hypothetical protein
LFRTTIHEPNSPPKVVPLRQLPSGFDVPARRRSRPGLFAQGVVSSGMTGLVRDNPGGKPIANASVTAVHTPTGTSYSGSTTESGRYNFRGLNVGGPYTVATAGAPQSVEAHRRRHRNSARTSRSTFVLETGAVVVMEKFTVKDQKIDLDCGRHRSGLACSTRDRLLAAAHRATFLCRPRPDEFAMVTLRNVFGDRQEGMLAAVGTRTTASTPIMLDGARINDQFGLNASGLAVLLQPPVASRRSSSSRFRSRPTTCARAASPAPRSTP